ncbi:hypothetical protein Bbelb_150340, partial [Branchiostoma belcheri]
TVGELNTLRLSCPEGQSLVIDEATFRHYNRIAEKSLLIVWNACQGLQRCNVTANVRVFACSKPFGMISHVIPDDRITASSYWDHKSPSHHEPYRARVRLIGGAGSGTWAAGKNNVGEWLQVDLGGMNLITGTIIQGSGDDFWVRSYKLRYCADGTTWTTYADSDGFIKVFKGNTDRKTPVTNLLDYPIYARYVRFVVQLWQQHISMRVEILGCSKNVGDCEPNPCANGGTCLDREGGFDCACPPPFNGKNCSVGSGYHWTEKPLTGSPFMFDVEATNFVSPTEFKMFWITWSLDGTIAVGRENETQPFLEYKDPNPLPIIYAGLATNGNGDPARCRLPKPGRGYPCRDLELYSGSDRQAEAVLLKLGKMFSKL